jgi:hypothetical protein
VDRILGTMLQSWVRLMLKVRSPQRTSMLTDCSRSSPASEKESSEDDIEVDKKSKSSKSTKKSSIQPL